MVHVAKIAVLPSLTRIALFLAMYHTATADDDRTMLLRNVFRILALLLQVTAQDPASVYIDMYVVNPLTCHSWPGARRLQGIGVRRWIYCAASEIITLRLTGRVGVMNPSAGRVPLPHDPFELVFAANSNTLVASALDRALYCIRQMHVTPAANGSGPAVDALILNSFFVILKDVFVYAIRNIDHLATTESQGTEVRNWPATYIVARLAYLGGLSKLLTLSSHVPAVQVSVLRMALKMIRAVLCADTKQGRPTPPISRHDPSHPAIVLATMFRGQYAPFCRELMEHVRGGQLKWPDMEGALVDFISLSGNLAFYSAPPGAQLPDELVISSLLPFLVTLMVPVGNEPGPTSSVVRRHAWGTLGSIGTLYTVDAEELRNDSNPQRHFLFETFEADDLAAGLLQALMLPSTGSRPDIEPQFRVGRPGNVQKLEATAAQRAMFMEISSAALKAIAALWKAEDSESVEVRDCLRRHGLAAHLRPLSEVDGEATEYSELANEIMARIFDAERDTPPDSPNIPR